MSHTDTSLDAVFRREAEAANLEAEADDLDDRGNPGRAAFLREQARILRAVNRTAMPKTA
jgi:hypothetical protein